MEKQVAIFSDTLMNIMLNFAPNETIICDDRPPPPALSSPSWMNKEIKQLIERKNQFYKRFIWSNKALLYINRFKVLQGKLGFMIEKWIIYYYSKLSRKLSNKTINYKAYWSILKTFLNDWKISCKSSVFFKTFFTTKE